MESKKDKEQYGGEEERGNIKKLEVEEE